MNGLQYQLKNIRRDKMCILTFLLPVIVGLAVSLMPGDGFSSIGENSFGVAAGQTDIKEWLEQYGTVTIFTDAEELKEGINDPSTQMIGVVPDGNGIRTLLSGDELDIYRKTAYTLPELFEERESEAPYILDVAENTGNNDGLRSLLIVIVMVTAMFMGCTFNAMSMISEKEEGIGFVNEVIPMSRREYILQKIMIGFIGGMVSTVLTGLVCIRVQPGRLFPLILLILLSAYTAALAGVFIGRFSQGLLAGIGYIKMIMILFLAPPILCYLIVPQDSIAYNVSYILPSAGAFYGLMDLLAGQGQMVWKNIFVLAVHSVVWSLVFAGISGKNKLSLAKSH